MRRILRYFKKVIYKILGIKIEQPSSTGHPIVSYQILEASPISCRTSEVSGKRINLLVPALSSRYAFGGINTAVDFFLQLIGNDESARIIITEEASSDLLALPNNIEWTTVEAEDMDKEGRLIICFGNRSGRTIPVKEEDVFIATAWWTAYVAEGILKWQENQWHKSPAPIVYLIQDFEPGFYKWSSRYSMSLSTYHYHNLIAIFNTKLLADYFTQNELFFEKSYVFEPALNRTLSYFLSSRNKVNRKKRILFYGRPGVERNAFEIIINGLQLWCNRYQKSYQWEVVSLGESYHPIRLNNGEEISIKGKVSLQDYAGLMLTSAIGISLMISPHPSYPPLEMAAFNMGVITNNFGNKDLSQIHDGIFSLMDLDPENLADLLTELCNKFDQDKTCFADCNFKNFDFIEQESGFNFLSALRKDLGMSDH